MNTQVILLGAAILVSIALIAAIILHFVSKVFRVIEDPRIDDVEGVLPGANCGGCGFAGCRNFAEAIVKAGSMDGINCPAGGNNVRESISKVLGLEVGMSEPMIAVIRCNGSRENAPPKSIYDGASTCAFAHIVFAGESACPNGCLGYGDCVNICGFGAMQMDPITRLPIIDNEKCVACGACLKSCPRSIIELRPKGKKDRRIFVGCQNTEKGAVAKKNCSVACIGCGKCAKVCPFEAITIKDNLAYIDFVKCKLCRKCVAECPTSAIQACNFPHEKEKAGSSRVENVTLT